MFVSSTRGPSKLGDFVFASFTHINSPLAYSELLKYGYVRLVEPIMDAGGHARRGVVWTRVFYSLHLQFTFR